RGRDRRRRFAGRRRHDRRRRHDFHRRARRKSAAADNQAGLGALWPRMKRMNTNVKKIVLAYSGGLDTSVMLRWLKANYDCEVVCFCADVGQGAELSGLEEKA